MVKRICSIILSVLMCCSFMIPAYAEEATAKCEHKNYQVTNLVNATCEKDGKEVRKCADCSETIEVTIPKLGGTCDFKLSTTHMDCLKNEVPYTVEVCTKCYAIKEGSRIEYPLDEKDLSKREHKWVAVDKKDATCTEEGHTAGVWCEYCHTVKEGVETIAKKDHVFEEVSTTATCTTAGVTTYKCACGETKTKEVAALGHQIEVRGYKAATCVAKGNTGLSYCARKDCEYNTKSFNLPNDNKDIAINPNNHADLKNEGETPATCFKDGYVEHQICNACNKEAYGVVLPKHETKVVPYKAPKCAQDSLDEEYGNISYIYCAKCNKYFSNDEKNIELTKDQVTLKPEHTTEIKGLKQPTCSEDGYTGDKVCKDCGKVVEKGKAITGGHKIVQVLAKDATCTEDGNNWHLKCSKCGEIAVCASNDYNTVKDQIKYSAEFKAEYGSNPNDGALNGNMTVTADKTYGIFEEGQTISKFNYNRALLYRLPKYAKDSKYWSTTSQTIAKLNHMKDGKSVLTDVAGTAVEPSCFTAGKKADQYCDLCKNTITGAEIPAIGHHDRLYETKAAVAATCTEKGKTAEQTCRKCKQVVEAQQDIPALGHDYKEVAKKDADCKTEANGYVQYKCSRCNDVKIEEIKWEHDYKVVEEKAPTCTEDGYKLWKCTKCSTEQKQVLEALGHVENAIAQKDATCTETGLTAGTQCKTCGLWKVLDKEGKTQWVEKDPREVIAIDPAVHPMEWFKWNRVPATCTENGRYSGYQCEYCGKFAALDKDGDVKFVERKDKNGNVVTDEEGDIIYDVVVTEEDPREVELAYGHNWIKDVSQSKAPTFTEEGVEVFYCNQCGETYKNIIPNLAQNHTHDFHEVESKEATCVEDGYIKSECVYCDAVLTKTIKATGHKYATDAAVAPTCTNVGLTEGKHCTVCGEVIVAQEVIPALGHTEVVDSAVAATCTTAGKTEGKHCSVCGEVLVAQKAVPALGHKTVTKNAKKATYFAAGYTGDKVCSVCGKVITKGKAIAKLKLAKPSITVTAGSKKLTVKISKKVTGATGYQVSYTVKGGKTVVKTYSAKTLTKVISKLSTDKTYTVKVRARVKSGSKIAYSSWSSAKSVKVK